jgi:hypothetical protein
METEDPPVALSKAVFSKPKEVTVRRMKSPETSSKQADINLVIPEPIQTNASTPAIAPRKPKTPFNYDYDVVTPPVSAGAFDKGDHAFNISARDLQLVLSSSPSPKESILKKPGPRRPKTLASALISVDPSESSED